MPSRSIPRSTLEQWCVLDAVVECGSFALAAEKLNRSQSAISYGISRLQQEIGVSLLETQGRRAVLTETGRVLLKQARPLIEDLFRLEARIEALGQGWESELRIAIDSILPPPLFFAALAEFKNHCPHTNIVMTEVILSGADEALTSGEVHMAVGNKVPAGFMGESLRTIDFVAVAHVQHPLHQLQRQLSLEDLAAHTHIVIRDSGRTSPRSEGWTGARQRWTVSSLSSSLEAIRNGIGYAWLPLHVVEKDLKAERLKELPLLAGPKRSTTLYLIHANRETAGPAALFLEQCLRKNC